MQKCRAATKSASPCSCGAPKTSNIFVTLCLIRRGGPDFSRTAWTERACERDGDTSNTQPPSSKCAGANAPLKFIHLGQFGALHRTDEERENGCDFFQLLRPDGKPSRYRVSRQQMNWTTLGLRADSSRLTRSGSKKSRQTQLKPNVNNWGFVFDSPCSTFVSDVGLRFKTPHRVGGYLFHRCAPCHVV